MPISHVRVQFNVFKGEAYEDVAERAVEHAKNMLFENALQANIPIPTDISVGVDDFTVEAWYEYRETPEVLFVCPECEAHIIGHTANQIRDLLAKHYELLHMEVNND